MIHILIAEDEKPISNLIRLSLKNAGYLCDCAFSGTQAADLIDATSYDLILLDIMLPDIDGFELMEYIRPLGIPVIFITAKNSVLDKVKGLRMGAEDYIVKPFEIMELLARVDVVLRRYHKTEETINIAGLLIDTRSRKVTRDGVDIALTPKNMNCYCYLCKIQILLCIEKQSMNGSGKKNLFMEVKLWICISNVFVAKHIWKKNCLR